MASRHRRTFDIYGNSLIFHTNDEVKLITTNRTTDTTLHLNFKFLQLNRKFRFNIETEHITLEKLNTETKEYETKFRFA
jgi:hypothetical protein